jgi:hypothetical protein
VRIFEHRQAEFGGVYLHHYEKQPVDVEVVRFFEGLFSRVEFWLPIFSPEF